MAPDAQTATVFIPPRPTLGKLQQAAAGCTACDLYKIGTQTVFGDGPSSAELMLVGEQPGDKEDLAGEPFVGPAGQLLDRALLAAGIDRKSVYVTNPSSILRGPAEQREKALQGLTSDLARVAEGLRQLG